MVHPLKPDHASLFIDSKSFQSLFAHSIPFIMFHAHIENKLSNIYMLVRVVLI